METSYQDAPFNGIHVFKIEVYITCAVFNDGRSCYLQLDVMKEFGLSPGPPSAAWVEESNEQQIFYVERREETIEVRTSRRKIRLQLTEDYL